MVKKMLIIFSVCFNIGFIIIACFTLLQHKGIVEKKRHPGLRHIQFFDQLNLNAADKVMIDSLVTSYINKMDMVSSRVHKEKMALFKSLGQKGNIDDQIVNGLLVKIQKYETEREALKVNHLKKIKGSLSDDQAALFFQKLADHKNRHHTKMINREKQP